MKYKSKNYNIYIYLTIIVLLITFLIHKYYNNKSIESFSNNKPYIWRFGET